jgi:uncharacterized membrane protein YhdT
MSGGREWVKRQPWPLLFLAAPAFVAVWSGWVELGTMTGFGKVNPLPGIPGVPDDFTINTAITLPIGVEAYGAYALGTWLSHKRLSSQTRWFAGLSAAGALLLGAAGQVAYHLLEVSGRTRAPWWITTIVACLPVLVLGMGAALAHLIRRDAHAEESAEGDTNGGAIVPADRVPEWLRASLRFHPEPQVTAEVADPWERVPATPNATPPWVALEGGEDTSRATVPATPGDAARATVTAPVRATGKSRGKGGTNRPPKGGKKRRTRQEIRVALQRKIADLDSDQIKVQPLAQELGTSRQTIRELLDEMDVRPIPTTGARQ